MGSDARAFIFDIHAFREEVLPAVQQFVRTGARADWLDRVVRRLSVEDAADFTGIQGCGLSFKEVCHYLEPDFAFTGRDGDQWARDWNQRACASKTCVGSTVCPLHESRPPTVAADFNLLVQACVVDRCLGPGQFLGRSMSPLRYAETLRGLGVGADHPLTDLLLKLEYRGFVVGFMFANSDGIHGWLTESETERLHEELQVLDLPKFAQSFDAMASFRHGPAYQAPPEFSFQHLSLAFLRTVAGLARCEARGLLWGNDVHEPAQREAG